MSEASSAKRPRRDTDLRAELPTDRKTPPKVKIFNDPIHGSIEIHPLCVKIIDTPQFQRLRHIRQVGACYHVYPGATHNRFEHSIGVSYLAGVMVDHLMSRQPDLGIIEVDKLCVMIAGLCHDLGHGPFSHMFDQQFLPMIKPKSSWTHEQGSIDMFDHLYDANELKGEFLKHGFEEKNLKKDLVFIKELIYGPLPGAEINTGRPNKPFLYEIVSNKRNSVDVDKWDYLARDCLMLGIKSNFDHMRCIKMCRVIGDGNDAGIQQLCFRDKEVDNLYEMFHIRHTIHRRACKHAVTLSVDIMYAEALFLADKKITIRGSKEECKYVSECKDDVVAFTKLTDDIFERILWSDEAKESKALLERVNKRQLYKCIGQAIVPADIVEKKMDDIKTQEGDNICSTNRHVLIKKFEKQILDEICGFDKSFTAEELLIKYVDFDYSMQRENPVDNIRFFSKFKPNVSKKIGDLEKSLLLPKSFEEHMVYLYYKSIDVTRIEQAKNAFEKWSREAGCSVKFTERQMGLGT